MPDQRILCTTCSYLVRPEHFPCTKQKRKDSMANPEPEADEISPEDLEAAGDYYDKLINE